MAYTTIDNPEAYFQVKTYTGNGSDDHAITLDGTTDMSPNMVWIKDRERSGYNHCLIDSVRGVTKVIRPNLTNSEATISDALKSFDSDGFTLDDDAGNGEMNINTETYVAWCWKAGTAFSNDASATSVGTLDSSGSSSQTSGFSIVSYTSNGSSSQSVAHNLGAVPHMIISKNRDSSSASYNYWTVYHHSNATANDKKLKLNTTDAVSTTNEWGDTDPTSTVYSLHTTGDGTTNVSTDKIISYVFTGIQGYSKFGSFVANNQSGTNGSFVYLGFKTRFFMWKNTTTGNATFDHWNLIDTKRQTYNGNTADGYVQADSSTAETSFSGNGLTVLSNGVQISQGGRYHSNTGDTYIYMAFAEAPLVNSNGIPCNAR